MKTAPDPKYVQEFLFKQSNTSQVFDGFTSIPAACNLLAADKKRGLLYIGHDDKITVLKPPEKDNAEWKTELQLPGIISKIAISCDYSYIAVAISRMPTILIYDVHSLARNNLNLLLQISSSNNPDSYITDIRWNPSVPVMLCTVTSDYTVGSFQLKIEEEVKENSVQKLSVSSKMSNEVQVLCAAWSPKGKQIVVGCKNGYIVQLKPELKIARTIAGPSPSIGEVISILWISNYQFCAAYLNSEKHINVIIIDAPRGEANAVFTCYEDITYGIPDVEGEGSVPRYYFEHIPEWGLIIAGSSSSIDIAVLGTTDGGINWNQWQLVDSGRAQLPLMRTTEIYPIGLAIDKSPLTRLPWGADSILQHPVPILHILGTSGILCSFHIVNLIPNCPVINTPPTELITAPTPLQPSTSSAEISFSINAVITSTPRPKQVEIVPERSKPMAATNIFGDSLKTAGFFQQTEPSMEQSKPQEEKSTIPTTMVPKPSKEISTTEPIKTEKKITIKKEATNSPQVIEQKASIDDSIRMRAYLQEQALFEKELRSRLEPQAWECGTDEEKKRLGEASAVIEQFLQELKDTTNSLSSDIAYLKALLLQSFAWVEETKSKNASNADINPRSCSENGKLTELQNLYYYTQTQLSQVSKILDLEWSEHKMHEKSKMKIPSLEFVYQNLLLHNKIVAREKQKLEQISRKWKSFNRSLVYTTDNNVSNLNRSMSNLRLGSSKSSTSSIRGNTDIIDSRCKAIALKTLNLTHEKQIKLKSLLTECPPRIIKPVNPSAVQDRLKATLSSLASTVTETKMKTEPPIVKYNVSSKPMVEKTELQNPLASLNSIVARIGSTDTPGLQNKIQQKPLPNNFVFSAATSVKQIEKKPIVSTTSIMPQIRQQQDLNVNLPSMTFGTSASKSQDILFPKSSVVDTIASKESMANDVISRPTESALFSTGLLKNVLPTDYSLTKPEGLARNISLSTKPTTKTDAAATFSFATPNMLPSVVKSSSATALDTMMSFNYSNSMHTSTVEPSIAMGQTFIQPSIDLTSLSLGSPNPLTLLSANHSNNNVVGKPNIATTSMNFTTTLVVTQPSVITTIAPSVAPVIAPAIAPAIAPTITPVIAPAIANIGEISISLINPTRKTTETIPNSVTIEEVTTSDSRTPNFGAVAPQVPSSLPTPSSIFGSQTVIKNMAAVSETATTLPVTTSFGAIGFPSITPTFGTPTSAVTASIFSGFSNTSAVTNTTSVATVSSTTSPFQSPLNKPTFGGTPSNITATSFGIDSSNTAVTTPFGIATTAVSITPTFGKSPVTSPTPNAQFPSSTPASTANVFGKSVISPASSPFGNTSTSVFSSVPVTTSSTSIFGGSTNNSIFGSTPLSPTTGNIFGGNSAGFGTASSGSIFDNGAVKSGIFGGATNTASASPFSSTTSNASSTVAGVSAAGANVFRSTVTNTSPMGGQQPVLGGQQAFGQAPAFGSKPLFGSPPSIFGAPKPVFGSGFGSPPTFEGMGFGGSAAMPGSTMENAMPKVFGEVTGNSTFESLASQSGGLSFGSLAQKSPEPEKPAFTAGSSFSSWR